MLSQSDVQTGSSKFRQKDTPNTRTHMLKWLFKFMCRDALSAPFRGCCMLKLHFHARANALSHMAREKFKQKHKKEQSLTQTDITATHISFDSLVNKVVSICCDVYMHVYAAAVWFSVWEMMGFCPENGNPPPPKKTPPLNTTETLNPSSRSL